MAKATKYVVQETGHGIAKHRSFKFRLRTFFRRVKARGDSSATVSALSIEPDRSPTPPTEELSQMLVAETGLVEKLEPEAKLGTSALGQGNLARRASQATDGDVRIHDHDSVHEEDGSYVETVASQPTAPTRDLWAEAWISNGLTEKARDQLRSWNRPPSETSDEPPIAVNANRSTKPRETLTEDEQNRDIFANKSDYVNEVIDGTTKKLEEYQNRWGTQSETTAVDQARKVLVSILTIKQLVEAGLKFDPSGYASCAWAVVSFGLTLTISLHLADFIFTSQLVENDKDRMDRAFKASADCAELLARYCKIESYLHQTLSREAKQDTAKLENAIVEAYVAIFNYSAAVKEALDGSSLIAPKARIKGSFRALTEKPFESLKKTVEEKDNIVGKWEDRVNREYEAKFREDTKTRLEVIGEDAAKIIHDLDRLQAATASAERNLQVLVEGTVLDWLSPKTSSSTERHEDLRHTIDKMREGEEHWFLQKPEYVDWKTYPQSVLWLYAPSGYGKSSLCSTIIENLAATRDSENPRQKVLVYWYFQSNNLKKQDLKHVLRSFLRELLASSPENEFLTDVNKWLVAICEQNPPPSRQTLLKNVKQVIERLQRDVFIVLDGLDEIPPRSKDVERKDVLQLVHDLIKDENLLNIHVLLTSTFENDIKECLMDDDELKLIVDAVNVEDGLTEELNDFIDRTMGKDSDFKHLDAELKNKIKKKLKGINVKNGLRPSRDRDFRWVTSLLDDLRKCYGNKTKITKQLDKVPNSMAEKYEQALKFSKPRDPSAMRLIIIWLLRHKRFGKSLTVEEVVEAARLETADELARLLPGWLMRRYERTPNSVKDHNGDGEDASPQYIEFDDSVQEHLEARCCEVPSPVTGETRKGTPSWFIFSDEEAHLEIATRCLNVLLGRDDRSQSGRSPLKKYAAQHWHEHYLVYAKALPDNENPEIVELDRLVEELLTADGIAFKSWLSSFNPDTNFRLSNFDLEREDDEDDDDSTIGSQTSGDSDSFQAGIPRGSPVYYAVKLGLLDMALKMIKKGDPCAQPGREGTVLQLALYHEHWEVVDTLLCCCDDSGKMVKVRSGPHGTPLYIASAKAQDERALGIVKTLIQKGAPADGIDCKQDGKYGSALHAAAYFGHVAAVQLLLDEGIASVDQGGGIYGTALHAAAISGHHDTIKLLLDHEANPTIVGGPFGSPLLISLAYGRGSESATDLFLKAVDKHGIESGNRSGIGWESAFDRFKDSNGILLRRYRSLFPMPTSNGFRMPKEIDLAWEEVLLAGVLENWDLRGMSELSMCQDRLTESPLYQTPAQQQLEEIKRALPDFTKCSRAQELNRRDFCYKALFWSGINYILEHLKTLVERAMVSMKQVFQRAGVFSGQSYEYLDDVDFPRGGRRFFHRNARTLVRYREEYLDSIDRVDFDSSQRHWRARMLYRRHFSRSIKEVDMDLSDKIFLEMTHEQQQEMPLSRKGQRDGMSKVPDTSNGSTPSSDKGGFDNKNNDDKRKDTEIHLVLVNLLLILKEIVEFGRQCDWLHGITPRHGTKDDIKDLTFEVFAAVVRLAVSINKWEINTREGKMDTANCDALLAQTVRLIGTVRLPRMVKLAAAASHPLPHLSNGNEKSTEINITARSEAE